MRASRGFCLFVPILAGLRETLADSTHFNIHTHKTPALQVKARHELYRDLTQHQVLPDYGTLSVAFRSATWIWTADESRPLFDAPIGDRVFRTTYTPPAGKIAVQAEILITVDNSFSLFVNGMLAGTSPPNNSDSWKNAQGYQIALNPGPTVFAVRGTNLANTGRAANPAGVLAAIRITHSDATQALFISDRTWRSNTVPVPGSEFPTTNDSQWPLATALARFGTGPWGLSVTPPSTLVATTLPPPSPSSTLPSSASLLPNSTSSLPSSTFALPPTSSSTPTITQTSLNGDTTARIPSHNKSENTENTKSSRFRVVLISASICGMIGGLVLLTLLLVSRRRTKRASDVAAADFDTRTPAPHNTHTEPFMNRTPSSQHSGSETRYGQPQAPYRYPPPSMSTSPVSIPASRTNYYQPQYGGNGVGGGQGPATWGSSAQLVPAAQAPQSRMNSVPLALIPGRAAPPYYSPSNVASRPIYNPYEQRY